MSASLQYGMPPVAYSRENEMSDRMQAILQNPYYLVREVDTCPSWIFLGMLHARAVID